ncbi:hypothetical protein BC827DRAFT_568845 [Russula dissimulans]|nr:hypothetical protein BC827DRAFT_568845 [Russula dissimulans]
MPTIASSSSPHRPPPGDADLQELYDQVLSAFAEESSPSNFSPTFSISRPNNVDHDPYSPHSDEGVGSHIPSRPHPQSRASASPRDNNRLLPSPTTLPTSPTLGKGPRPLPRLPGASPNSPSTYPTHMPEPRPFFHDPQLPTSATVMALMPAHPRQLQDHTPAAQIRFSTPCPLLILLLLLFRPTANPGTHQPREGVIVPMAFNPPQVPCKRNHPTDPPVPLRPEYLVTLPFLTLTTIRPSIHYHQSPIPLRVTLRP